ncbi:MAG: hypothetical protein ACSHWU_13135 [Marinicella sp.]
MNLKNSILMLLVVFISACAPKYNYLNNNSAESSYDHILVVFDYLHFVDDVGKLMDYPADINQTYSNHLKKTIQSILRKKEHSGQIDFVLTSSGLGLNPEIGFEHYHEGQLKDALIYPPFYLSSAFPIEIQDQLIQSFADAQNIAFTPVSTKNEAYFNELFMSPIDLSLPEGWPTAEIDPNSSVAVLHVRAVFPRVSFMKAMGVSLLSAGVSAGISGGAYVSVATPTGMPYSTALLYDNNTGIVVWKNQMNGDLSRLGEQSKKRFFKQFPLLK